MVKVMKWYFFWIVGMWKQWVFLYTIIILKVGPLSYNILKNLFYMVSLFEN